LNIVFRVDATQKIGVGHLMRCISLSEELTKRKNVCYFLSKIDNNYLINKINEINIYKKISHNEEIFKFLNENDVDWIITDHYDIKSQYIKKIQKNGYNVLSIDDTSQIHYYSDIVVNQNIGSEKLKFSSEKYTEFLLGTKYVMLRDELLKRKEKIGKKDVKKILITLGGSDNDNITLKILRSIENKQIEILLLIGCFNPFYNEIKNYAKKNKNIKIIISPKNMADIYLGTDISISAGGSTCYELAYFGIPNIIITLANNQLNIANELCKKNISFYAGKKDNFNSKKLNYYIEELINNKSLYSKMKKFGIELIDGKGKKRIVNLMDKYENRNEK